MKFYKKSLLSFTSVRSRMLIIMTLILPLSFAVFIFSSFRNTTSIINDKIYNSFQVSLNASGDIMDACLDEMHAVSSTLAFHGSPLLQIISKYYSETTKLPRAVAQRDMESLLLTYEFNSSYIGLITIIDLTDGYVLASTEINTQTSLIDGFPKMNSYSYLVDIHQPHSSISYYSKDEVISLYRPFLSQVEGHSIAVYLESDKQLLRDVINPDYSSDSISFHMEKALVSASDTVLIVSNEELVEPNSILSGWAPSVSSQYNILQYSTDNWTLYGLVDHSVYNQAIWPTLRHLIISIILIILLHIVMFISIWNTFYNPIKAFTNELKNMSLSSVYIDSKQASLDEFDEFRSEFIKMRKEIHRLVTQAELQAKRNAEIENELLLSRINPHFLHNTLDNIRWISWERGEKEVAQLLTALNHLIYYNLGKQRVTTLKEELNAVDDYLLLQKRIRPFRYEKHLDISDDALNMCFPCYTLQPFIENSLLHGYADDLLIQISIKEQPTFIQINISDNGKGMPDDTLLHLQQQAGTYGSQGMGIGLSYVFTALKMMYADTVRIQIDSILDKGSTFSICINKKEVASDDQRAASR